MDWLAIAEFVYNNREHLAIKVSPFFANKGYNPNLDVHPECDLASMAAQHFVVNLNSLHQELKLTIAEAQKHYQVPADQ